MCESTRWLPTFLSPVNFSEKSRLSAEAMVSDTGMTLISLTRAWSRWCLSSTAALPQGHMPSSRDLFSTELSSLSDKVLLPSLRPRDRLPLSCGFHLPASCSEQHGNLSLNVCPPIPRRGRHSHPRRGRTLTQRGWTNPLLGQTLTQPGWTWCLPGPGPT